MKWIRSKFPGIRYREHNTRKHGVKFDRYFSVRYKLNGRDKEEGLGWASQGWNESRANEIMTELRRNHRIGSGPQTIKEMQLEADAERKEIERAAVTVSDLWERYSQSAGGKKSFNREESAYRLWIKPVIGKRQISGLAAIHLEKIKKNMADAGRAPRSIQYTMAVIRQLFNHARKHDLFHGDNPVSKISMPKFDNRRMRFLSHQEADLLLKELKKHSQQTHDMAFLSLYTGMRAGEVFALKWRDVDVSGGVLTLRNTKNTKTRFAYMTDAVKKMFLEMEHGDANGLVFPGRGGVKIIQISETFNRAVNKLRFNDDINDRRFRVTFHTLRHSFASWLVEAGTDLYVVKELLGHSDFKMTSRYAHLGQNTLQQAVKQVEQNQKGSNVIPMRGGQKNG